MGISAGWPRRRCSPCLLLDAAGTDVVFLETVGAGQSEVEVMSVADEVVLVLMPGSGDSVQALKAGIMEIPDVIAVNKMDQPGAKALQNDIRGVIALDPNAAWRPPIVLTEALRGEGVDALWSAIVERRDALAADGELEQRRRGNLAGEVVAAATARARGEIERAIAEDAALAELVASVQRREVDPLTAADRDRVGGAAGGDVVTPAGAGRPRRCPRAPRGRLAGHAACSPRERSAASRAASSRSRPRTSS